MNSVRELASKKFACPRKVLRHSDRLVSSLPALILQVYLIDIFRMLCGKAFEMKTMTLLRVYFAFIFSQMN